MLNVYFHLKKIHDTKVLISFTSHIVDEEPTDVIHKNRVTFFLANLKVGRWESGEKLIK